MLLLILLNVYTLNFGKPKVNLLKSGGNLISAESTYMYGKPGAPFLPERSIFIALPEYLSFNDIKFSYSVDTLKGEYSIPPVQKSVPLSFPAMFKYTEPDKRIYSLNKPFPEKIIEFKGYGHIFGIRVAKIIIHPVQYIPSKKQILYIKKLDISLPSFKLTVNKTKNKILTDFVLNQRDISIPKINEIPKEVIITAENLIPYFNPLLRWERQKGISSFIRSVEWIYANYSGRDYQEQIRNYIKTLIDSNVVYVLLGGDGNIIPIRHTFAMSSNAGHSSDEDSIPCDLYYADLDGDWDRNGNNIFGEVADSIDMLPDVIVGRAPVIDTTTTKIFVNKVINYERAKESNYQRNILFLGNYLDSITDGGKGKDITGEYISASIPIRKLYSNALSWNASMVVDSINQGMNFINHDGHGWINGIQTGSDYLNNSNIDTLENYNKITGLFFSLGCWTAAFDYDCFAEHFVLAPNGGGFYIGNSRYGWYMPGYSGYSASDVIDHSLFKHIFQGITDLGEALSLAKAYFSSRAAEENDYRWVQYTVTFFGDPSMHLFTDTPSAFNVKYKLLSGNLEVNVSDTNGFPVQNASVSLTDTGFILASGYTDESGFALFQNIKMQDTVYLTVSKDNFFPCIDTLTPISNVVLDSFSIIDTAGNNDGVVSAGEQFTLWAEFLNGTGDTIKSVYIKGDSILYVLDTLLNVNVLPDSTLRLSINACADSNAVDGNVGKIHFIFKHTTNIIDTLNIPLMIHNYKIALKRYGFDDMPGGGSGNIYITFENVGEAVSETTKVPIIPIDTFLMLSSDTILVPPLIFQDSISLSLGIDAQGNNAILGRVLCQQDTLFIPFGFPLFSSDCSDTTGWEITNDYWHLTNHRYYSFDKSWYSGIEGTWTYPAHFKSSLITPYFSVPPMPVFGIRTFYNVEAGMDFCIVEYQKDTTWKYLDVYDGPSADWELHQYNLDIHPGDSTRIKFTFYSEADTIQYEGWYIDDISLKSAGIISGIPEMYIQKIPLKIYPNPCFSILYISSPGIISNGKLRIYDILGRKVIEKHIQWQKQIKLDISNLPEGIFIIHLIRDKNEIYKGRFIHF